jgi:hypothetical protein
VAVNWAYANITTATTTVVKTGFGQLHAITINKWVTAATITIYDNTSAAGTKIGTITLSTAEQSNGPFIYDVMVGLGITVVTSGATDITISYA